MSDHRFSRIDFYLLCRISKCCFNGSCLKEIVVMCTGSVRINVVDFFRLYTSFFHGIRHSMRRSAAVFNRRSNVVGIGSCAISHYLSIDLRTTCFCMLKFLQNNNSGSFSNYETASFFIEWNGRTIWILTGAKGGQIRESSHTNRADRTFRSPCDHNLCITILDCTKCISDTMCSRRTGSHYVGAFSPCTKSNGYVSSGHIADHFGNKKRVNLGWSALDQSLICRFHCLKAPNSGSHDHSNTERIFFSHFNSCICHSLLCCSHCILGKQFHSFGRFEIHIIFCIKIFYFCRKLHLKICSIKSGNFSDSYFACFYTFPEGLHIISHRCYCSKSSHHYTSFTHNIPPSTHKTCPVIYLASGDARNATALATSSGSP